MKCGVHCKSSKGNNVQDKCSQCKVPKSQHKAHAAFMRTPAGRMCPFGWDEAGFTWRAHITLPEADGAAWGAAVSHKPHGSLCYHRCKGNLGFLNLQLGSPWLCPHTWVVQSSSEATLLAIPPIARWLSSQGGSAGSKLNYFQKKLKRKFSSRTYQMPSHLWIKIEVYETSSALGRFNPHM